MRFPVEIPRQATLNTGMAISCRRSNPGYHLCGGGQSWAGAAATPPAPARRPRAGAGPAGKAAGAAAPSPTTPASARASASRSPRRSAAAARDEVGRQPAAAGQAAQGRLAAGARRVQGRALRRRAGEPAAHPRRAQRRRVRGGERRRRGARRPRPARRPARPAWSGVFAKGFNQPFGIAFYPPGGDPRWLYVANTDSVVRLPYRSGDLEARGPAGDGRAPSCRAAGGCAAAATGRATSRSRATASGCSCRSARARTSTIRNDAGREATAPTVLEFDARRQRASASTPPASATPVGIAVHPRTGELWASVNERDELGDNLVPDYITHVEEGGFYGWPWYYIGGNQDPRHRGKRPELKDKVDRARRAAAAALRLAADGLLRRASSSRPSTRATSSPPSTARGTRAVRTGYKVIRVPMRGGARDRRIRGSS